MSSIFPCASCGGLNRVAPERLQSKPKCGRCGQPLRTDGAPVTVSDEQLRSFVQGSPVPVLVDFYSDSCGPCRMLAPVMQQLGQKYAGKLIVLKVDTQRHQQTAAQLGVRGIPALFLYKDGRVVDRASGFRQLPEWEHMVRPHLAA
jgi:thioredoxin 2